MKIPIPERRQNSPTLLAIAARRRILIFGFQLHRHVLGMIFKRWFAFLFLPRFEGSGGNTSSSEQLTPNVLSAATI
jgi:hypothetical protein